MQHLIDGAFNVHLFLHNGHHTICYDRRVDLNADCVFGRTLELFYLQMLLDPLEEKLNLPSVAI